MRHTPQKGIPDDIVGDRAKKQPECGYTSIGDGLGLHTSVSIMNVSVVGVCY